MRTLTKEEINTGKVPVFRTDIMELINPGTKMEDVTDMVQVNNRLLVCSGDAGRIYNMDSRTFDIEGMTSFKELYPGCAFVKFAGVSANNNIYLVSRDRRGYVYDYVLDELMLTEYFKDLDVDAAVSVDRPVFVNYETSVFYSPSLGGVTSSLNRYVDFNIWGICAVGSSVYVMATYKVMPSYIYLSQTTFSLGNPTILQFYDSLVSLKVNRNSLFAGSKSYSCLYYTCEDGIYYWDLKKQLSTTPVISIPVGMEITSLSMNPDGTLLYVGLHEKEGTEALKGHLYVYDVKTSTLISQYHNIADKPVAIIYKERA